MKKVLVLFSVAAIISFSGCTNQADTLGADVYDVDSLNMQQDAKTVQIINISPAKVAVDNKQAKENAQMFGGILGAVGGAVLGHKMGGDRHETAGATAGGVAGAAIGAGAGSLVDDKIIVEGVTLAYKQGTKIKTSTQAGRMCQFKEGTALMITTKNKETRIQPNAICPDTKK